MKQERLYSLFMTALALCMCCTPAMRGGTLFSDLGPPGDVYGVGFYPINGAGADTFTSESQSIGNLFTVSGTGSLPVTEIDLAVGNASGPNTFYANIWTDDDGLLGTQVAGAYWSLTTSAPLGIGACCSLVSITGISGVILSGGQQYFMVLGPLSPSDDSFNGWEVNSQGVTGVLLYSFDGGATWGSEGPGQELEAFDVTSNPTPEPATCPMLLALAGAALWWRFRKRSAA
ncbi:MAG: choice-of-anchor R domain-containing protein [Bryobacteraceae bacterium]